MAQESVEIIKTILESKEGKEWFFEYLKANLKLEIFAADYLSDIGFNLRFNGLNISTSTLTISSKIHVYSANKNGTYQQGVTIADIAKNWNICPETINKLLVGDTFGGKYRVKEKDYRILGRKIILEVNGKDVPFKTVKSLAKVLGLSESAISNILAGRHPIPTITSIKFV